MKKALLIVLLLGLFISCSTSYIHVEVVQKYPVLDYRKEILLIPLSDPLPVNSTFLGTITIDGYAMKKRCEEVTLLEEAKLKAREIGGNAIKMVKYLPNYTLNGCARMTLYILKLPDDKATN